MPTYDFENAELPPRLIHEQLRAHDKRMRDGRDDWAMFKETYLTKYWRHVRGYLPDKEIKNGNIDVEVNRLWGVLTSYLSSLYPRASRTVLSPDPAGSGDPVKAELAINRWLGANHIHQRIMSGLRQALLYPGCGAKIGYTPGTGSPLDRVWVRIIPWWELVLDSDVGDPEDERFRGHVYYKPLVEVEREYGLENLKGTERTDFLSKAEALGRKAGTRYDKSKAESDNAAFVRVLELCHMRDTIEDENDPNIVYQGRLEIYILGQGELSREPVWMGPMPFANADGTPLPHVSPLIFNHEPEFPLRGIAHSRRLMPQIKELNSYRSWMAMATRKDTRQYVTRKGTFGSDELTSLTEGHDGLILEVEQGFERPLADAILPIPTAPISTNIDRYLAQVETDLSRTIGTSPAAQGIVTKATAFEVATVQQYTESEFGMHGAIKDRWLGQVVRIVIRALIAAMQDSGDSAGAFDRTESIVGEAEALPDIDAIGDDDGGLPQVAEATDDEPDSEELEAQAKRSTVDEFSVSQSPMVDDDLAPDLGTEQTGPDSYVVQQEALRLRERDEIITVTSEDLDGEFEINFVEGGRTPLTDAAMQQNLVALMEPYMALWQTAQKGGPGGVFAKSYMKVIAERFDFPKDLHPEELEARAAEAEEEQKEEQAQQPPPQQAQPQQPPQQPPPQQAPPGQPPMPTPQDLAALAQMPPEQALAVLREVYANDPEMMALLAEMESLPPERQAEMLQTIAGGAGAPV